MYLHNCTIMMHNCITIIGSMVVIYLYYYYETTNFFEGIEIIKSKKNVILLIFYSYSLNIASSCLVIYMQCKLLVPPLLIVHIVGHACVFPVMCKEIIKTVELCHANLLYMSQIFFRITVIYLYLIYSCFKV